MSNWRQIFFQFLFLLIRATSAQNQLPSIDPVISIFRNNESARTFLCNGHRPIEFERLVVEIDRPVNASPSFLWKTRQFNSTTIEVTILPNDFVGKNRILCFWEKNSVLKNAHDITIGALPGRIQLKEHCRAFDRQYVQCTFYIPTVGRAYRNGFDRNYSFVPLNRLDNAVYREIRQQTEITDKNEMIVRFRAEDPNLLFKSTPMMLTMSIGNFGTDALNFFIEPIHTTRVLYAIEPRSKNQLTLLIDHTNENVHHPRVCSGHIDEIDTNNKSILTRNIFPTSELKIDLNHLEASTSYKICLRCYYNESDHSFNEKVCQEARTVPDRSLKPRSIFLIVLLFLMLLGGSALFVYLKWKNRLREYCHVGEKEPVTQPIHGFTPFPPPPDPINAQVFDPVIIPLAEEDQFDSGSMEQFVDGEEDEKEEEENNIKYKRLTWSRSCLTDIKSVSPDTVDLTSIHSSPSSPDHVSYSPIR